MATVCDFRENNTGKFIEWKVKKFLSLTRRNDYFIESPIFSLSGTEWCILIRPKDGGTRDISMLSMVLKTAPASTKAYPIRVAYSIGIKKCDGSKYKSKRVSFELNIDDTEHKADDANKSKYLQIKQSRLMESENIFSWDGCLTVFCDVYIHDSSELESIVAVPFQSSEDKLAENLKTLLLNGQHSDSTIHVKGREFKIHKSILSARSPVFGLMLEHDMAEKNSGMINIDDCEPEDFQDFLLYIYTGKMHHVSSENARSLYKIADKYDITELKKECVFCMENELSVSSFCDVAVIASVYNESELLDAVIKYFNYNFAEIFPTTNWMTLVLEQPRLTNELLNRMGKAVRSINRFHIFVKMDKEPFSLDVQPWDTIQSVKAEIRSKRSISWNMEIKLCFAGMDLIGERTLSDYDIHNGYYIDLFLKLRTIVNIFVKHWDDKTLTFRVELTDTIEKLKILFENRTGISKDVIQLFYAGKYLREEQLTLSDCNIRNESTIYSRPVLRGNQSPELK